MEQKKNKRMKIHARGSIAVFALIIMFILAVATIGIITTATVERKTSISTGNSTSAFQIAETGMEKTLQYFKSNFDGTLNNVGPCSVISGVATVTYVANVNVVKFKNNAGGDITSCGELISNVRRIKSIGTTKKETRAIEEVVFLAATKLLLHFNGLDSTTNKFTDTSFYYEKNKPITTTDTVTDSSTHQLGTGSAEFDGDSGYLTVPDSDSWNFKDGDFTIDFWVKFKALPGAGLTEGIYSQYHNTNNRVSVYLKNDGGTNKWFLKADNNVVSASATGSNALNTTDWFHIAYVKKGTILKIFQKGSPLTVIGTPPSTMPSYNEDIFIGKFGDPPSFDQGFLNGYLDELRVSKGVARWWSDFSTNLPSTQYVAD